MHKARLEQGGQCHTGSKIIVQIYAAGHVVFDTDRFTGSKG